MVRVSSVTSPRWGLCKHHLHKPGMLLEVPKQTWSTLKVTFDGPRFEVFFDGVRIMQVDDKTFTGAGKTGFWTKADSVTHFDDFVIERKN